MLISSIISLNSVSKSVGSSNERKLVLENVTARFSANRHYVIFGMRGAGKSTLLRLMSGVAVPSRGSINRRGSVSLPVGSAASFASFKTGRQLCAFLASLYDVDPREVESFVASLPELASILDKPVDSMPPQTRALLGYAVGYALPCDFYLCDNAVSYGTGATKQWLWKAFEARRRTSATILATRDMRAPEQQGDIGCILHDGQLYMFKDVAEARKAYNLLSLELNMPGRDYAEGLVAREGMRAGRDYLRQYLAQHPGDPRDFEMLADLSMRLGDHAHAEQASKAALSRGSVSLSPHLILAKAAERKGDFANTIYHARAVLRLDQDHREASVLAARNLENLGSFDEAARVWSRLSENELALRSYQKAGNWRAVLLSIENRLAVQPRDLRLLVAKGRALIDLREWTIFAETLVDVAGQDPNEALGLVYRIVKMGAWEAFPVLTDAARNLDFSAVKESRTKELIVRGIERRIAKSDAAEPLEEAAILTGWLSMLGAGGNRGEAVKKPPEAGQKPSERRAPSPDSLIREFYRLRKSEAASDRKSVDEQYRAIWAATKALVAESQESRRNMAATDKLGDQSGAPRDP